MPSDKERLSGNMEASDDEINPLSETKKPRQSCSTNQASISKVPAYAIRRQLPEPYIATLPPSSFTATRGLEVFPVPPPSPPPPQLMQPVIQPRPVLQPSCTSSVASENQPVSQPSGSRLLASTNRPVPQPSGSRLLASTNRPVPQPSCSSSVASTNQPQPSCSRPFASTNRLVSQPSCSSSVASTNPVLSSNASRLEPPQSVLDNGQTAPEGMELRIWNEIQQFLKSKTQGANALQSPSVVKDSMSIAPAHGEVLHAVHRPQEDKNIQKGIQPSPRNTMQNAKRPREIPEVMQHSQGETVEITQRQQTPSVQLLVQRPHEGSQEEQQSHETQRPRRKSARRMESQQKKQ